MTDSSQPRDEPGHAEPGRGLWILVMVLVLLAVAVQAAGEPAARLLRYERGAILSGEVWRLVSAHLVHLSWAHLILNAAALILMALLFNKDPQSTARWAWLALITSLGAGLGLWWRNPELDWYVGLSGTAHGLAAAGCVSLARPHPKAGLAGLAILAGKLWWEQQHGAMPGSSELTGGAVIVDAHLYGALAGAVAAVASSVTPRRSSTRG